MKRVLITGLNGYVGSALAEHLEAFGDMYEVQRMSVRNGDWRKARLDRFDSIVHTAAIVHHREQTVSRDAYFGVNSLLTAEIARAAKRAGVRHFVFMSTVAIYGRVGDADGKVLIDHNTPCSPVTDYGRSKLLGERLLESLADDGFRVAVVRPPMVYGSNCPGNYRILRKITLGIRIVPEIENLRSLVHIDNLCRFLQKLIDRGAGGVYHPQNVSPVSITRLMAEIAGSNNCRIVHLRMADSLVRMSSRKVSALNKAFGSLVLDSALSECGFEYCTVDFEESVRKTEQGWIR